MAIDVQKFDDRAHILSRLQTLQQQKENTSSQGEVGDAGLPDIVQLNAGDTALKFTACSSPSSSILAPLPVEALPSLWSQSDMSGSVLPPETHYAVQSSPNLPSERGVAAFYHDGLGLSILMEKERWIEPFISCNIGGKRTHWMVPISVHHINRLFYNKRWADQAFDGDFESWVKGKTLEQWVTRLETLPLDPLGRDLFVIPTDNNDAWTLSLLARENIRVALANENHPYGSTSASPQIEAQNVMAFMDRLRRLSNANSNAGKREVLSAEAAMARVAEGRGMFTVMGDWAEAEVDPDVVRTVPFPGTETVLVYTIDGFVAPEKPREGLLSHGATTAALAWLKVVGEPEVAREFARIKKARFVTDWIQDEVASCASAADAVGRSCTLVPALSMKDECPVESVLSDWLEEPELWLAAAEAKLSDCRDVPFGLEPLSEGGTPERPNGGSSPPQKLRKEANP